MVEEDIAAIEYAVTRALKNFDSVMSDEEHALIRLALRQGRTLSRIVDDQGRLESIEKFADSLIGSREKVSFAWDEVNAAVANLQRTWPTYSVKQLDSFTSARMKYENYLGRASGLSDIIEGVLQESQEQDAAQKLIDRLSKIREAESKVRKVVNQQ